MDTLPIELHSQILQAACLDDGSTARSLSLVSSYIRQVSKPYLYQSVTVAGLDSLAILIHKLHGLPPHMRRIRHLFLSDWTHKLSQKCIIPDDDASMERYDQEEAAIMRIIEYAAPTLQTLAFSAFCPFNGTTLIGYLFATTFPCLTDLTVHGFYSFPQVANSMPRLQHLHLSGNRNPHGLLQTGGLSAACPNLTHLRISGLKLAASFAAELCSAIELHTAGHARDERPPHTLLLSTLPPNLRSLSIQHAPCAPTQSKHSQAMHAKMENLLRHVEPRGLYYELAQGLSEDVFQSLKTEWIRWQ